ncbi:inner centromere protein-like [Ostrea edulis]|uniref:inner centromere protein-like n=1 Tax=Ostrea edulis TaxID=37623 RepID=UPI0024AFB0EA|nr:inner centromere protein-like [Ostrea edulis]
MKEEMEQRNIEFMQRKKEFEEQERLKKKAEERKKFEERMAEFERERVAEHETLKKIEEEKIRERQKLREERERQLAKERRDKERLDMAKRKPKDLELKQKMEKIQELEKKRMLEEERRRQELKERERAIQSIVNKHNMAAHTVITGLPKPNLNSTLTVEQPINSQEKMPSPNSYEMTPAKTCFPKKVSLESYDISDLHSDDSTDEDEAPKKKVLTWALGASLKAALIQQHYHPPDLNILFTEIEPPDLNELFVKKKARFNKRTSSAIWNSPILKPGLN